MEDEKDGIESKKVFDEIKTEENKKQKLYQDDDDEEKISEKNKKSKVDPNQINNSYDEENEKERKKYLYDEQGIIIKKIYPVNCLKYNDDS